MVFKTLIAVVVLASLIISILTAGYNTKPRQN